MSYFDAAPGYFDAANPTHRGTSTTSLHHTNFYRDARLAYVFSYNQDRLQKDKN